MFACFFPNPRTFFLSATAWALISVLFWYLIAADWGDPSGLSGLIGVEERTVWSYIYGFLCYAGFAIFWMRYSPHRWSLWSVAGSALIVFVTWFQVQLDVMINEWFGRFYDIIQKALAEPGAVSAQDYYAQLATFLIIAMVFITTAVLNAFFTSHFVFRWRTAMNNRYVDLWERVRHIEGASQRVQEDAMRFAAIMESLGTRLIDAVMTLIALPADPLGPLFPHQGDPGLRRDRLCVGLGRHIVVRLRDRDPCARRLSAARARVPEPAGGGRLPQGAGDGRGPRGPGPTAHAGRALRQRPAQLFPPLHPTTSISTSSATDTCKPG